VRLENKVALITGASSGIGREAALLFAREGACVVVADVDDKGGQETAEMIQQQKGTAAYVRADVSQAADCERMVAVAEEQFGKLNMLFNNAGIMHAQGDDAISTEERVWDITMNINAKGGVLRMQIRNSRATPSGWRIHREYSFLCGAPRSCDSTDRVHGKQGCCAGIDS
jgi:NAD(P)-dependent dehydrogenase (short-subunit alcohol dehydrogenase family)